jgi:hypothetical protein
MAIQDIRFSQSSYEFRSLVQWAKELSIPVRTLLHHSSQGHLRLFALPPREADYFSVHADFIGSTTPPAAHAQPISMSAHGVLGLVLANEDIFHLAAGRRVEQPLFSALIRKQAGWAEIVHPIPGRLGSTLRDDGWYIAAYRKIASEEGVQWSMHTPIVAKLAPVSIYARDIDVEEFVERLTSVDFIDDVFVDARIVENLPTYVSGKLCELIKANRLYWPNHKVIDATEKERCRREALTFLKQDFLALCDKKTKPESLLSFAASACDPTLVPQSKSLDWTSATPDILTLLSAAKLFWSAHCRYEQTHETYPARDTIVDFLRFMGMRESNAASSGTTLIRPEGMTTPALPERRTSTLLRPRQALPR